MSGSSSVDINQKNRFGISQNIMFTDKEEKTDKESGVWDNQSIFEPLERIFLLYSPQPVDFKSFNLLVAVLRVSLRLIFCWANFLKNPKLDTQNFWVLGVKIRDYFLSFSVLWGTLLHSICIIGSTRYLNFPSYLWVHLVSQCLSLLHFPFFSKISSHQFAEMHIKE